MSDDTPPDDAEVEAYDPGPLVDLVAVREKLKRAEALGGQLAKVWRYVRTLAKEQPEENPWFVPFVAAVSEDEELIGKAKAAISSYLDEAQERGSSGYLFNIWCFAFPHCRWAIWFDVLRQQGAYTEEEGDAEAARFLLIQHRDHHPGLLVKPYPECVDNQAASLVLSSLVIGTLFADGPGDGHVAKMLRDEAAIRLEAMLGGMPNSGYSGEGSTYQGLIVAFATPFMLEMLERIRGEELFEAELQPKGTTVRAILTATARLWMPSGLLLPWDDYGYQFGIRAPLAYLAKRTGDARYLAMLENVANWSRLNCDSSGWGHDEPIWTLIYWPELEESVPPMVWRPWAEDEVGASLVSTGGHRYLMQMWDPTEEMCTRSHVNPNSVVIEVDGYPITADGTIGEGEPLRYPGAVFDRTFGSGWVQNMNLSKGCGGSHSGIIIDGNDAFRPTGKYELSKLAEHDVKHGTVTGDVTGLYKNVYADCKKVVRRSRLIDKEFWILEDLVSFEEEHDITCRWWFRPQAAATERGVDVVVPEGAGIQLRAIRGEGEAQVTDVSQFPKVPDGASSRVDFTTRGKSAYWMWLVWPVNLRQIAKEYPTGWKTIPSDPEHNYHDFKFKNGQDIQPGTLPWLEQDDLPVVPTWAYQCTIAAPKTSEDWGLRLPRGLSPDAKLWVNGNPVPIPGGDFYLEMMPLFMAMPEELRGQETYEITLQLTLLTGHKEKHQVVTAPDGTLGVWIDEMASAIIKSARYMDGILSVMTSDGYARSIIHEPLARID